MKEQIGKIEFFPDFKEGWMCPVCKGVYSPYENECFLCNLSNEIKKRQKKNKNENKE